MAQGIQGFLARIGAGRFGPVRLAVVFALPTIPVVGWAVANPTHSADYIAKRMDGGDALTIAAVGVIAAALIGGLIGGLLTRRPTLAIFATVAVAWFVGVASLSVTSWLLGIAYEGTTVCIGICNSFVTSQNPISGLIAWGVGFGMSLTTIVPLVIAVLLVLGAMRFTRMGDRGGAAVMVVAAQGVAQFMTFVGGGAPALFAYVCLAVGVIAWTGIVMPAAKDADPAAEPVVTPVAI